MNIISDYHMHTCFSTDSDAQPETMVQAAVAKGMTRICITDHYDKDYVDGTDAFTFEPNAYMKYMKELQEKYRGQIDIRIGVEIGLQMHLQPFYEEFTKTYPFDFVIGSAHFLKGTDPYYKTVFQGVSDEESYRCAFQEMVDLVHTIKEFDVLGHMDYVVRYGNEKATHYSYRRYADYIDVILKTLIQRGKGIEVNTAGYKYGLGFAHPHSDVLKRYKELGGEILTIGADAHTPDYVGHEFERIQQILESLGFKYYTEFVDRKPIFCKIL